MYEPEVFIIEDDSSNAQLIRACLIDISYQPAQIKIFQTIAEAISYPAADCAIVLVSLSLYTAKQEQTTQPMRQPFSGQPVIIIAEKTKEEEAVQAVAQGAEDYILINDISKTVLQKTIRCAMARNRVNFKQFFEESPAPMYIYDKNTFQFLAVNKACCKQYGYTGDEFNQMTALQIRPAEQIHSFRNVSKQAPVEYHDYGRWKHLRKNGEIFTVNIYAHDTKFGGVNARLVTAVDISDTVIAEQQLYDKNEEVINILESIADGFFALNEEGEFTYVNKECEQIFGLRRSEMIGKNIRDVYDRKEYGSFYTQYLQAENKHIHTRFENYISSIGKWLSATIYPTKDGMSVYLVDITERRQIREKIYNDGQQLRAIINNTPDIIWLLNGEGEITVRNEAFRQWMHHLVEDADTQKLPHSIASNWEEYFENVFGGKAVTFTAMETKGSDLSYREVSLYPVRNAAGEVVNISCFARDVTQQQLRIQKIQLQNEYLEKIAWMHSHEARGPVANILGLASLFDMNDPSDPENRMMMELIVESSHQLDKVIRRIVADIDAYQLNYGDEEG